MRMGDTEAILLIWFSVREGHVIVFLCLLGVYTEYTRECVNTPEVVARGFVNTFPSEFCIYTMEGI